MRVFSDKQLRWFCRHLDGERIVLERARRHLRGKRVPLDHPLHHRVILAVRAIQELREAAR